MKIAAPAAVLAWCALALAGSASATICSMDATPAATLLVPHFQVDLASCGDGSARTTLLTLTNASPAPALVQVTMWTDTSVPAHVFERYLTGFDVESVDLGQVLCEAVPPLDAALAARFTGQPDPNDGLCYGYDHDDGIARGYVTIDTITQSSPMTPADASYHTDVLSNANQLIGHYTFVEGSVGDTFLMAHLEAHDTAFGAGSATLYGRYTDAVPDGSGGFVSSAADRREPLPASWALRYTQGAHLHLWREATGQASPFPCASGAPSWFPLPTSSDRGGVPLIVFNDAEDAVEIELDAFPLESQRILVGPGGDLPVPYASGWIYLNTRYAGVRFAETAGQSWAVAEGDAGFVTMPLDNACNIPPFTITPTGPVDDDP